MGLSLEKRSHGGGVLHNSFQGALMYIATIHVVGTFVKVEEFFHPIIPPVCAMRCLPETRTSDAVSDSKG